MPSTQQRAVTAHRRRLKERGLVRLEILATKEDRQLLKEVARRLREEPSKSKKLRLELRGLVDFEERPSRKAILASMPLEEADLEREPDLGREIDF